MSKPDQLVESPVSVPSGTAGWYSRAWVPDYRSSDTDHAANTAHGTNTPAVTNAVMLRAANQPISYPNTTVSPAPTTSKVA